MGRETGAARRVGCRFLCDVEKPVAGLQAIPREGKTVFRIHYTDGTWDDIDGETGERIVKGDA